jgi:3'(2'), 5'-bisphosphate nucleotidase
VFAPALDQLYWGGAGLGSFRQSRGTLDSIRVSTPVSDGQTYRVVASKSHLNDDTLAFIAKLGSTMLIQAGSSLKFCRVAEGEADIYPRLAPTCEWDTAAAQAIVEGAGGFVTDVFGVPLKYSKPVILNPHFIAASSCTPHF